MLKLHVFSKEIPHYIIDGMNGMHGIHSIKYMMKGKGKVEWLIMADEDVIYNQIWFYIINEMKESK
jgi:hypothetical protein